LPSRTIPSPPTRRRFCHLALATVKRRDEALLQAQNAVQQDPESFLAKWELACAYHWNGQHEEAIAIFEPLWANSGHNWVTLGLVPAYTRVGREDRARSLYESLVERHAREYIQPFVLALSATAVGEHEAAIRFCEAAIEGRDMLFAISADTLKVRPPPVEAIRPRSVSAAETPLRAIDSTTSRHTMLLGVKP
jgi:tetratricopeptide (TPR) repeat protein